MSSRGQWRRVYTSKAEDQASWFEPLPAMSVRMLKDAGVTRDSCVIDVGGGESRLVDHLVSGGPIQARRPIMMMRVPPTQTSPPMMSHRSGRTPSANRSQRMEAMT